MPSEVDDRPLALCQPDEGALLPIAYHEAGHAVAATVLGRPVIQVLLHEHGGICYMQPMRVTGGYKKRKNGTFGLCFDLAPAEAEVVIRLAGCYAERMVSENSSWKNGVDDFTRAKAVIVHFFDPQSEAQFRRIFKKLNKRAQNLVWRYFGAIAALANALTWRKQLTAEEVSAIVRPRL